MYFFYYVLVSFPQPFLSLVNLLSSSSSVWELLGRQSLANKSEYSLREIPSSIPVSTFLKLYFRLDAFPLPTIWGHLCSSIQLSAHTHILGGVSWKHKGLPLNPRTTAADMRFPPKSIVHFPSVFVLHSSRCIPSHRFSLCSTGFDWQADCCEFRCEDPFALPLRAVSHVRPKVRWIFLPIRLYSLGGVGTHDIGLTPGIHTHALPSVSDISSLPLPYTLITWLWKVD